MDPQSRNCLPGPVIGSPGVLAAAVVVSMGAQMAMAGGGACLATPPTGGAEGAGGGSGVVHEAEQLAAASLLGQLADVARHLRDVERQGTPPAGPPPEAVQLVPEPAPVVTRPVTHRSHFPLGLSPTLGLLDLPPPAA